MENKWGSTRSTRTVEFFHRRIGEAFAARVAASGKSWNEVVFDPAFALTKADFAAIEAEFLATGERFVPSAASSVAQDPEKYLPLGGEEGAVELQYDSDGRARAGEGDNVFTAANVTGIVRLISGVEEVMEMLTDGVPPNTVAVIDDAGGTLTAPVLEEFTAVLCKGGSVRSHLAILTREYGVPCLMNAKVAGLANGDRVEVEYSSPAKGLYEDDDQTVAAIWKLR
ncbi:MAG: PEP-utilizing enzyme [Nocardioides sp.]|uniref:PEP-utilizing enzyme n=1 Tax=Nocardioides sp. TaxID=35761 RepID=UPI0039E55E47